MSERIKSPHNFIERVLIWGAQHATCNKPGCPVTGVTRRTNCTLEDIAASIGAGSLDIVDNDFRNDPKVIKAICTNHCTKLIRVHKGWSEAKFNSHTGEIDRYPEN
jgi:hypothetical protein